MTATQKRRAAANDPDGQPPSEADLAEFRRVSPARHIRMKLGLSPTKFAKAYGIPLQTLLAWERHEAEPNAVELAYLRVIEREPQMVRAVAAE